MSEPKHFDYPTINTTTGSTTSQEQIVSEPNGFESLPRIDKQLSSAFMNNESQRQYQRTSTNRTAFGTSKVQNKFETLRKQSIHTSARMSGRIDDDTRRALVWANEGPSLNVS